MIIIIIIIISAVAPLQRGHSYTEIWIDLEFEHFNLWLADLLKSSAWAKWLILIATGIFYVCANRMSRAALPTWSVSTPCPRQWCIIRFTNSSKQLIRFTTSARKRPSLISCKMPSFLLSRYVVRAVETVSWTLDSPRGLIQVDNLVLSSEWIKVDLPPWKIWKADARNVNFAFFLQSH